MVENGALVDLARHRSTYRRAEEAGSRFEQYNTY